MVTIQNDNSSWSVWTSGEFFCSTPTESQAIAIRDALRALDIYVKNEDKIVQLCKRAGVDTDYCGNNAVSCVAELIERKK